MPLRNVGTSVKAGVALPLAAAEHSTPTRSLRLVDAERLGAFFRRLVARAIAQCSRLALDLRVAAARICSGHLSAVTAVDEAGFLFLSGERGGFLAHERRQLLTTRAPVRASISPAQPTDD